MTSGGVAGAAASGLFFGLSLIVAIGPQNAYVLRQGLRRERVLLVVGVCTAADVLMIAAGVGGVGVALAGRPELEVVLTGLGAAFLLGYAALAVRRAVRPSALTVTDVDTRTSLTAVLAACLAFTFLNPGVYVDTVFLVGPVAQSHGDQRWWFAAGAMVASGGWFAGLGYGARLLGRVLTSRRAWRVLDLVVAVVMTGTAVRLLLR
jgi:L-lysine exporter family protein LysE/ArgO